MKQLRLTFLLTVLMSMVGAKTLAHDNEVEGEYSSWGCNFAFQNATFLDETLASAMDAQSRGVFCQISESVSGGVTFLDFKNNMGMSSQKKEPALEQGTAYIFGINNGIIVGYQALSDSPNGGFVAYDLQCPNCVRKHNSDTNPNYRLTMASSGIATCPVCNKQYDMNNRGVIQNGEQGDINLIQYVATTTGPFGYIKVFAQYIEVANADGIIIYYSYNNEKTELQVCYRGSYYDSFSNEYTGDVIIPEYVTFDGKTYSVTAICSNAFRDCSGLTSVTLPNSITSIGDHAFYNCTGLKKPIYNSYLFAYMCRNNKGEYVIPQGISLIANTAFYGCSGLTSVIIPNSVTNIGNKAFMNCSGLTSVTIPNGVTSISDYVFSGCSGLTSVTIPNSVTSIGSYAFSGCWGLTSLTIPNSVTSIGSYTFSGCSGLTSVTIPNNVTSIGSRAFMDCVGLKSLSIGNGLSVIPTKSFAFCNNLTSVILGDHIDKIADNAFTYCENLEDIYCYSKTIKSTSSSAFTSCKLGWCTLHVPESSINLYSKNSPWSEFGNIVALTESDPKPTGIMGVKYYDDKYIVGYYSPDGQRIDAPRKGVNIIKYSNGETKKIVVK